jgi:hypothetical protein
MKKTMTAASRWEFRPVTPERLADLMSFSESHAKFRYMGSPATFRAAGFRNVTPQAQERLVMRLINRGEA